MTRTGTDSRPRRLGLTDRVQVVTLKGIIHNLIEAVDALGAKSDLLSIVGSFGDTLTDTEVFQQLEEWVEQNGHVRFDCAECGFENVVMRHCVETDRDGPFFVALVDCAKCGKSNDIAECYT